MKNLINLKNAIERNKKEILESLKKDLGKIEKEAILTEYNPVIEELNLFIKNEKKWKKPKRVWGKFTFYGCRSYIVREPYGNVLIISPWNYPFQLAMLPIIGAVGSGNQVTLKPSEFSEETNKILEKILKESNIEGLNIVTGDYTVSEKLLEKRWDYIFFTGSTAVGRKVYEAAAKNITPVTLELGGKSPVVIEPECDFENAVEKILWGKFINLGQTCIAPDYAYIPRGKVDEFLKITERYLKKYGGAKGRIINEKHYKRVLELLKNQNIIYKDGENKEKTISFHIILNPNEDSPVMQEEIFGPILPILEYEPEKLLEVYESIKRREKPLALYIFRKDNKNLNSYGVSSGGVCINGTILQVAESSLPFGGVGQSGIGNYHGKHSFNTFTHEKSVLETTFLKVKWLEMKKSSIYRYGKKNRNSFQ